MLKFLIFLFLSLCAISLIILYSMIIGNMYPAAEERIYTFYKLSEQLCIFAGFETGTKYWEVHHHSYYGSNSSFIMWRCNEHLVHRSGVHEQIQVHLNFTFIQMQQASISTRKHFYVRIVWLFAEGASVLLALNYNLLPQRKNRSIKIEVIESFRQHIYFKEILHTVYTHVVKLVNRFLISIVFI